MGSFSLSSNRGRGKIFDGMRQAWVAATPEECVRQQWLRRMVDHLGYPAGLLVVEKQLKELPHLCGAEVPDRRLDILCYGKRGDTLFPLLLLECKEGALKEDAVNQVIGYNYHVGAQFIAVVNMNGVRLGCIDFEKNEYTFCSFLPPFKELMQWVK